MRLSAAFLEDFKSFSKRQSTYSEDFIKARFIKVIDDAICWKSITIPIIKYKVWTCEFSNGSKKCSSCKADMMYGFKIGDIKKLYSDIFTFTNAEPETGEITETPYSITQKQSYPVIGINSFSGEVTFLEQNPAVPFDDHVILYPTISPTEDTDEVEYSTNSTNSNLCKIIKTEISDYNTRLLETIGAQDRQYITIQDIIKIAIKRWETTDENKNEFYKFLKIIRGISNPTVSIFRSVHQYDKFIDDTLLNNSWEKTAGVKFDDISIFDLNDKDFSAVFYILRNCVWVSVDKKDVTRNVFNRKKRCMICISYKYGNHSYDAKKTKKRRLNVKSETKEQLKQYKDLSF